MLSPDQERRLVGGGDSHDHFHSTDRIRVHDDIAALQKLANVSTPPTGAYSVAATDDFILADNAGPYQLPKAKNGRVIEFVMTTDTSVTIDLYSGDAIHGETSILLEEKGTAIRLKAIDGGWVAI